MERGSQDCIFYLQGRCNKVFLQADNCEFRHSDAAKNEYNGARRACQFFLSGNCTRPDCKFVHLLNLPPNNVSSSVHKSHDSKKSSDTVVKRGPCYYFSIGKCTKGDQCFFEHNVVAAAAGSNLSFNLPDMDPTVVEPKKTFDHDVAKSDSSKRNDSVFHIDRSQKLNPSKKFSNNSDSKPPVAESSQTEDIVSGIDKWMPTSSSSKSVENKGYQKKNFSSATEFRQHHSEKLHGLKSNKTPPLPINPPLPTNPPLPIHPPLPTNPPHPSNSTRGAYSVQKNPPLPTTKPADSSVRSISLKRSQPNEESSSNETKRLRTNESNLVRKIVIGKSTTNTSESSPTASKAELESNNQHGSSGVVTTGVQEVKDDSDDEFLRNASAELSSHLQVPVTAQAQSNSYDSDSDDEFLKNAEAELRG